MSHADFFGRLDNPTWDFIIDNHSDDKAHVWIDVTMNYPEVMHEHRHRFREACWSIYINDTKVMEFAPIKATKQRILIDTAGLDIPANTELTCQIRYTSIFDEDSEVITLPNKLLMPPKFDSYSYVNKCVEDPVNYVQMYYMNIPANTEFKMVHLLGEHYTYKDFVDENIIRQNPDAIIEDWKPIGGEKVPMCYNGIPQRTMLYQYWNSYWIKLGATGYHGW
jgi:hypothetical protein